MKSERNLRCGRKNFTLPASLYKFFQMVDKKLAEEVIQIPDKPPKFTTENAFIVMLTVIPLTNKRLYFYGEVFIAKRIAPHFCAKSKKHRNEF